MNRRDFLQGLLATTAPAAGSARAKTRLGLDNFAVRAMKWRAPQLIEYAAALKLDSLFISDLDAFESFDDRYLRELRQRAARHQLQIHLGTWSICPTSRTFKPKWGTADEHLALGIRVAHAVGSPVLRVILGNAEDRKSDGGIRARIADTVKVLRAARSRALDAGVKIAMENHAGDMQAREVVALIEEAGKDFVGANLDSGNAVWTMEDPLTSLEVLGPYALTTSLRDSAVWQTETGAAVQWTAMGDGQVDWRAYFDRFAALCPGVPVHIETISGFNRELPYLRPEHWAAYPEMRASELAAFVAFARRGSPRSPWAAPPGQDRAAAEQNHQKGELERSLRFCRQTLGLGLRPAP